MRLFIAVEIGEHVAAEAGRLVEMLRRRAQTLAPRARVTWVTPGRMHLTVRFIGEVDAARADAIGQALAAPLTVDAFDLIIGGIGAFPERGTPRVIWAGLGRGRDALLALEREVTARLRPLGIAPENRPYNPHLTLARVREPEGLRTAPLVEGLADRTLGTARIAAITLFESRLSPKGPAYAPRARTALSHGA
jgi:2'-5' RNA ligase